MAENMLSNRPDYGHTFNTTLWVVGGIAGLQIAAAAWAILKREPTSEPSSVALQSSSPSYQVAEPPGNQPITMNSIAEQAPAAARAQGGFRLSSRKESADTDISFEDSGVAPDFAPLETPQSFVREENFPLPSLPDAGSLSRGIQEPGEFDELNSIVPEPAFYGPVGTEKSLSESLSDAALSAPKIDNLLLEGLVAAGEEHRAGGNMPAAIRDLKDAESALPDHPRILAGLAAIYQQMGLDAKAEVYWQKIFDLGEFRAGDYYKIADRELRGETPPSPSASNQVMKVEKVEVEELPAEDHAQRVSLGVTISAEPSLYPLSDDMALIVYFFDQVDGSRIEPSTADTSNLYPTEPYDWQINGREEIVVNYTQPKFSEEEARELGDRKYYGYIVELYYRDELQDKVIMPSDLAQYQIMEAPGVEEPAYPASGPENALFPE